MPGGDEEAGLIAETREGGMMISDNESGDVFSRSGSVTSSTPTNSTLKDGDGYCARNNINNKKKSYNFAPRESEKVTRVRRILAPILLIVAGVLSYVVYFITDRAEQDNFEDQFREDANKVAESFALDLDLTLGALDFLATNLAAEARATNQTWPYVTINDFPARVEKTRALTSSVSLQLYTYVTERQRWEDYSAEKGHQWVEETLDFQQRNDLFQEQLDSAGIFGIEDAAELFWDVIFDWDEFDKPEEDWGTVGLDPNSTGPFLPLWQASPLIPTYEGVYNWDLLSSYGPVDPVISHVINKHAVTLSDTYLINYPNGTPVWPDQEECVETFEYFVTSGEEVLEPVVDIHYPLVADSSEWASPPGMADGSYRPQEHPFAGLLLLPVYWRDFFKGILSEGHNGLILVHSGPCQPPPFTYRIDGPNLTFMGSGDHHNPKYDGMKVSMSLKELADFTFRNQLYTGFPLDDDLTCPFTLTFYPSVAMEEQHISNRPLLYTLLTIAVFVSAAAAFFVYDYFVEQRGQKLLKSAKNTDAIVSKMLPEGIRDRLYVNAEGQNDQDGRQGENSNGDMDDIMFGSGPLAELYPSATIIFIDIAGFTAWSSTREPGEVFQLLETIYSSWDNLAYKNGVLKIETVGDCYVAVAGLPEPNEKHVLAVCRFARDVLYTWDVMTQRLEVTLGPDTTHLKLRIGVNSGQVTAGILRGTMTRYQLFGDSVNTTARLQTSSEIGKIHLSQASANLLRTCGKERWLIKRSEMVTLRGKGETITYWLRPKTDRVARSKARIPPTPLPEMAPIVESSTNDDDGDDDSVESVFFQENGSNTLRQVGYSNNDVSPTKIGRLVEWNTKVLADLLSQIMAARQGDAIPDSPEAINGIESKIGAHDGTTVLEEFQEIIELPVSDRSKIVDREKTGKLPSAVLDQLRSYIQNVAAMYRNNHFHNFEHATHVASSVRKLLSRIVQVDSMEDLSGHSYGITNDPLTQFTVVLSAVIHDCDHPGIPNTTMIAEDNPLATAYKNKSIAEQHSVDLCWRMLMDDQYKDLRGCIYRSKDELLRFRQLLVNITLATDIVDKELKALRNARWEQAFSERATNDTAAEAVNRKATIVLEHLIQASDVCHTMQHWDVYKRWNEHFFFELYSTYRKGRAANDPSLNWYEGEIGFFDFYIIPLAKKLDTCGVFGVSSHEYLDYAEANRERWVEMGEECVAAWLLKYQQEQEVQGKHENGQSPVATQPTQVFASGDIV